MRIFLDTNIFVYALDPGSHFYRAASSVLTRINDDTATGYISHQILAELYATVTRTVPEPLSPHAASLEIERILEGDALTVLPLTLSAFQRALMMSQQYRLRGKHFFDAQIAATMLDAGIMTIYTNDADFQRFREIEVINPFTKSQ